MKPRPEIFWPAFVVALFAGAVLANMVLVFRATGDPSHAVLPDYYQRALRWDEKLAQDRRSAALGWQLRVEAARPLRVTLADRSGRPIDRATLRVSLFHKARSSHVLTRELTPDRRGAYSADLSLSRPGLWELHFDAERDGERFSQTVEHEVDERLVWRKK